MTRPSRLARYGFGDNGARAADLLGPDGLELWDAETQEPVDGEAGEIVSALSRAADPNLALRQLHRLVESAQRAALRRGGTGNGTGGPDPARAADGYAVLHAMRSDAGLRHRLVAVLGASSALGDHLVANPEDWSVLATGRTGLAPAAEGRLEFDDSTDCGPRTVAMLRRAYRLGLLRIAAIDLTGGQDLELTMDALSALADATLAAAYAIALAELPAGTPAPRLGVVAMGKCGGNELNYVSDVDVIFVAAGDDDLAAGDHHRGPAHRDLRAGRLAGRRRSAAGGQPRPAGADPRQPPRLLPAVGPHLGVPGTTQGPSGGR